MLTKNKILKSFLKYYKPYKFILFIDLLCAGLSTICELVFPMIVRKITNYTIYNEVDSGIFNYIIKLIIIYIFLRLIDTGSNYYMAYTGHVMGAKIETDMRRDIFKHLQKLPFSFYDEAKTGQIMSRITNDLFDITEFAHHCPEEFFIAFIKIIGAFIILLGINVKLTLLIFLLLPLMLTSIIVFRKKMKSAFAEARIQIGELNANLEDSISGIRVVKSFVNEKVEEAKFDKGNQRFLSVKQKAYKYMSSFQSVTRFFDGIIYISVIVLGFIFIIKKEINAADLIAYLLFIQTLIASVRKIVEFTEQFQKGITGIERFSEIINESISISDSKDAISLSNVKGKIKYENVNFSYNKSLENVLTDINLDINQGENIAIVGPSGAGKSTLCNLIPRFYEVTKGNIYIDDINIKNIKLRSLRKNIGIVQQDVYLFNGTIFENILYGDLDANEEKVIKAAEMAGAHDFITSLPQGYHTNVGEKGVKLSGGQKQRISIARLFLKNPPILILDEATSSLDNESEQIVQQSLEKLSKNRTTLTIAHRLTTIKNADKIIVLTEDGISETGSHNELIEKKGVYKGKPHSWVEIDDNENIIIVDTQKRLIEPFAKRFIVTEKNEDYK